MLTQRTFVRRKIFTETIVFVNNYTFYLIKIDKFSLSFHCG